MKIAVADDNLAGGELMRELLEASGHRVVDASNGREALDLTHRDPPDVVFLDLQVPVLDGFCVVRQLRSQPFPPPGRFGAPWSRHWPIWGTRRMQIDSHFLVIATSCRANDGSFELVQYVHLCWIRPNQGVTALSATVELTGLD